MKLRAVTVCIALALGVLTAPLTAQAQQPQKIPRIGFLISTTPSVVSARIEAFRQGLRELGYAEGKNIVIEWRHAEGKADRLPALAAELVRLKVDVLVASSGRAAVAAKQATSTIPIVVGSASQQAQDRSSMSLTHDVLLNLRLRYG